MTKRATMIIFHPPDTLEFAANGRSLGRIQHRDAKSTFDFICAQSDFKGRALINDLYARLIAHAHKTKTENLERTEPL